jgi:hypothetical protein
VSSHPLKHMVPAALFSAVVIVLTVGVSAAQAALIRGRGAPAGTLPTGHGGTSVGLVITAVAIVAVIAAGIVYAIVVDRRELTPAGAAGEPTRQREAEQERKAA